MATRTLTGYISISRNTQNAVVLPEGVEWVDRAIEVSPPLPKFDMSLCYVISRSEGNVLFRHTYGVEVGAALRFNIAYAM